ncbi:ERBB receptor feedback inhibitor 1 isoform X2 [Engraulis encrasicolus]|uniref:ERBB receptor feedback inhibitor 1 isoform X2 n=1 Tax=Engraulis encrasicolus TaxID=184585 RepID=UPI002FD5388E
MKQTKASMLGHAEGDQVVPSFKRLSVYEQQQHHHHIPPHGHGHRSSKRAPKPLPPLPDPSDLSSDEAVDSEVEFFTTSMEDDRQRLIPEHHSGNSSSKAALSFRYGVPGRRSFRGCGQTNYAYFEGGAAAAKGSCLSAQGQEKLYGHGHGHGHGHAHAHGHGHKREQREPPMLVPRECASRQPDRPQRRLRRTHSGPAGSFKTAGLRLFGHGASSSSAAASAAANNNANNSSSNSSGATKQDKPEVPPRVPIPPLPAKSAELRQRWSTMVPSPPPHDDDGADTDGGDKPPEIPPREPIPQCHVPRPYSPKSLPIYVNGVMPPTQSFAPNPKYVSKAPQQHRTALHEPHCTSPTASGPAPGAGSGPGAGHNPCILPIMEDGKKASATHYFLLPHRPAYLDRYARFFRERDCETDEGACS